MHDIRCARHPVAIALVGSLSRGLSLVIVPCWNQLEFTRQCIRALRQHTRPPWELIVIDNGSTDDTAVYLSGVQDATAVPTTVITNAVNRGFPAAINQGLKVARGEHLVLLNSDVVVTDAWLDQLVALANAERNGKQESTASQDACLLTPGSPPLAPPSQGGESVCSAATPIAGTRRTGSALEGVSCASGGREGQTRRTGSALATRRQRACGRELGVRGIRAGGGRTAV
jgi:hypothetical protein